MSKILIDYRKKPDETAEAGTVNEYLAALKGSSRFGPQVVHHERLAGTDPVWAAPARPWPVRLRRAFETLGIDRLYSHQAAAVDHIREGRSTVVATPTASGKSLIYNLPVFEQLLTHPGSRALYLFPLKALAQDQLRAIEALAAGLPPGEQPMAAICDGDTSSYRRKRLREQPPDILITNPDMLHLSMLGYHQQWASFFSGITHVVIDEVHTYRGVFGSHMAWVLRRLRRLCCHYNGREPVFLLSSATIGNPGELAADLLGTEAAVVTETGAPQGERHFLFLDPHDSAAFAACQLLEAAIHRGLRTIVYTQSRKMTELISLWTEARLGERKGVVSSYRSGFLPEERREIEARMTSGELLGVVATSALELGIDIGDLDLCILVGYPGTVMATWQRGGRVGRRQRQSAIVMVAQEDALDQHFMRHPEDFFGRGVEAAVVNPANPEIARRHLICGAAELPLAVDEPLLATESVAAAVAALERDGELLKSGDGRHWFTNRRYPHREVDLRGSGRTFAIRRAGPEQQLLGEIDGIRCFKECHPGAVYLHRGQHWLVTDLDLEAREVTAVGKRLHYFTRPLASKETEILEMCETVTRRNFRASRGRLRVTDQVTGFQKRLVKGQKLIGVEPLDLPPHVFETEGLWIEIPASVQQLLERRRMHFMGGIHAMEHAAIGIFPLLVLCDRNDIGGIAYPLHPQLGGPAVFLYDGYAGGVGLCREAFGKIETLLAAALDAISACPCEVGCPSCVHSPKCGSGNRPIDKHAAGELLTALLQRPSRPAAFGGARPGPEVSVAPQLALPIELPARFGVFDVETQRSAAEVGGWHRAERMGVSVAVLYEAQSDSYHTFYEDEMEALVDRLRRLELVVGFNNSRFDNRVLSAYTAFDLNSLPTLDLLQVVRARLGYRLSLDHLAAHTLGVRKTADGLMALRWYKEGRLEELAEYCRKDVEITRDLLLFGARNRYFLFRNKAGRLVRCPVDYRAGLAGRPQRRP